MREPPSAAVLSAVPGAVSAAVPGTQPPAAPDAEAATLRFLQRQSRGLLLTALFALLLGFTPIVAWLGWAPLSSAVVASGVVKVDQNRRPVQHAEGGIVAEVRVRDGDRVRAGDAIVILGDVSVDADRERLARRMQAERVGLARLEAEVALIATIELPPDLLALSRSDPQLVETIRKEQGLFQARRDALLVQRRLLREQRGKIRDEVAALDRQMKALGDALALQRSELEANRRLLDSGFISATRITQLEAAIADYDARRQERASERVRAEQRAVEVDLREKTLESDYRQQASDLLKQALVRLSEVQQEMRKTADAARRQAVLAPVSGEVMNLAVHTAGAVIRAGETIADLVPADARQLVEARVRTDDIRQVRVGQAARVHLLAYRSRAVDQVRGAVVYVGADRLVDPATQAPYYVVQVETSAQALAEAGGLTLQPGMPADVYIEGDARTVLAYLAEPITQVVRKAGREW
ncbi:MAG: HlyD family type I secretion periplasmic adaptor subunit [Lautropia sp.]